MSFAFKRIWGVLPVVFGVLLLTFLLVHLVPGDPVEVMLGDSATSGDRAQLRAELGLDRPLPVQFGDYLKHIAHGDFGRSIHQHTAISSLIAERVPATFKLALLALAMALVIGLPLGIAAALHHLRWPDRFATLSALTLSAMPHFWLGPLLMLVFSLWLGWLPISGMDSGAAIVLPALTLACGLAAILTRMTRASLLETLNEDFVRTARAKGLPERLVILRHALKPALLPVVTVVGLQLGSLLAGAVITETVFGWEGIGRLLVESIEKRDYPVTQACVLVISLSYVVINLLTDLAYGRLDPRTGIQPLMKTSVPTLVVLFWLSVAIITPWLGLSPDVVHLQNILSGPDSHAWLGYDDLGRDILARLLSGARVSVAVAATVTVVTFSVGTAIGLLAGYFGGWLDKLLMHITDVFLAFPGILLAIAFAAVLGPGIGNLVLALCMTSWVGYTRLTRAQVLAIRGRQHVLAAQVLGASIPRILGQHILPLLLAPLLVEMTFSIASLIIAEASLSFLGLGIQPPAASWGAMLRDGTRYLLVAPHYVLAVGLSLMSLVLAVNMLGDRLRDRLDVKR